MDFEEFKKNFKSALEEKFKSEGIDNLEFREEKTQKVNENYEALVVKPENGNVGPSFNMEKAFKDYNEGKSFGAVTRHASEVIKKSLSHLPNFDELSKIRDYDQVKSRLTMEVVSAKDNADILQNIPHKNIEDMALVYRIDTSDLVGPGSTVLITNGLMENYGINVEQLHEDAMQSAPIIHPAEIKTLGQMLVEQLEKDGFDDARMLINTDDSTMFIATVEGTAHGASVIAYEGFMDKAAERIGGDFFILPSSRHEVILIPDNGIVDMQSLEKMVREVNATTVEPEDKLTDNVYHYDSKEKIFELGEKHIERQASRAEKAKAKKEEKKSVLGELKAAKEESVKKPKKDKIQKESRPKETAVL